MYITEKLPNALIATVYLHLTPLLTLASWLDQQQDLKAHSTYCACFINMYYFTKFMHEIKAFGLET